jgi:hypothetical protein
MKSNSMVNERSPCGSGSVLMPRGVTRMAMAQL